MPNKGKPLGPLHVLMVEDCAEDAELLSDQMLEEGLEATFERVDNEVDLRSALQLRTPDVVLSDLSMPGFSGYHALAILQELHPHVPFVFVSGTMGEENAVQALHEGASDYIIKHQSARLTAAVARVVREARADADRNRVESELMRAQRLESLAILAAGLSHDLRNILQPLLIVPDLIRMRSDDPQLTNLADVISECGRRGHEMVDSMLSFVRGSSQPNERIEIERLFQAVELLLRSNVPDNIRLTLDAGPPGLAVQANHTELQQVLLNLALNAIQAMPEGGDLKLFAERTENIDGEAMVQLGVKDQGIGMTAATLAQLFSPFFTTKSTGTGLGLVSCKRIVESSGGRINVHSVVGQGTHFEVLLPQLVEEQVVAIDDMAAIPVGRGQRILVVDGEATRLSLLGNALASQGYRLRLAPDGAAAMRHVQEAGMPDVVIIDSAIRLLSAEQLLREMRALQYRGKVIILEDADAQLFGNSHAALGKDVSVLTKPLEMQRVFRKVAKVLGVR
jgi:signal transduction histidine kinase